MSPEDMQRFQVEVYPHDLRDHEIGMSCTRCEWGTFVAEPTTLAELVQRAEEHGEVCR